MLGRAAGIIGAMSVAAVFYILLICGLIPYASIRSARALDRGAKLPDFKRHVYSALTVQAYMLISALVVAQQIEIDDAHATLLSSLFPRPHFEWKFVWVGLAALAVTLGTLPIRRRFVSDALKRRLYQRMPKTPRQLGGWSTVSLAAGFGEEVVYRGVLFNILAYTLHGWWPAAIICSAVFAIAHVIQGWFVAGCIFLFAVGFHGMVWYCGDLYTAMVVHFVYDLVIGIIIGFWLRPPPEVEPASAPDKAGITR